MKTNCLLANPKNFVIIFGWLILTNYCYGSTSSLLFKQSADLFRTITKILITDLFPFTTTFNSNDYMNLSSIIKTYKSILNNEDIFLSATQILNKYGYKVEEHEVQTSDGYLLTMFRIPSDGPAVFLMHGFSLSSDDFITLGPGNGLAYVLADAGYDVWLGNARGTKHSKRHIILSPALAAFWDFSWDEIGRYDQSAMIDYALDKANRTKLSVIGYSQGSTTSLVLCSERPEYNDKISVMILLSAVSFYTELKAPLVRLISAPIIREIFTLAESLGIHSLLTETKILKVLTTIFCGTPELAAKICHNLFFAAVGPDYDQVNMTSLPVIWGHYPAGASLKQVAHFSQLVKDKKFRQYDYGKVNNFLKYGTVEPPDYPLNKITTKVAIFYAENDWFCVYADFQILRSKLSNVESYTVPYPNFNHFDYIFAKDVKTLVYDKVLKVLNENNNIV